MTVRVGDAERDASVAALIDHHLHGRLSIDELDRRQRAALEAVTTRDLELLIDDLPRHEGPLNARPRRVVSVETADIATKAALRIVPVGVVLGGASVSQWAWQHSAEGPFLGALAGGALGYLTHAVLVRFRR
jgi:hypothetical protein